MIKTEVFVTLTLSCGNSIVDHWAKNLSHKIIIL